MAIDIVFYYNKVLGGFILNVKAFNITCPICGKHLLKSTDVESLNITCSKCSTQLQFGVAGNQVISNVIKEKRNVS